MAPKPENQGVKKPLKKFYQAKPVSDLVSKLVNPVIERRAGMTTDLMLAWEDIVGDQHARHSRPEKLDWPRKADAEDPFEPATLIVACEGAHALFLGHESSRIISHINQYFGFAAVKRLKIVQKPVETTVAKARPELRPLSDEKRQRVEALLSSVDDHDLKTALEKMGIGVFSRRSGRDS